MDTFETFIIPSDIEFFEQSASLINSIPDEGYWVYQFEDNTNTKIVLHLNIFLKSVQVDLLSNDKEVASIYKESAKEMKFITLKDRAVILQTIFEEHTKNNQSSLEVYFTPNLKVKLSELVV